MSGDNFFDIMERAGTRQLHEREDGFVMTKFPVVVLPIEYFKNVIKYYPNVEVVKKKNKIHVRRYSE